MFPPSTRKFFLYGIAIAGLEEFITQGVLKESYFLWVFTLIPFGVHPTEGCAVLGTGKRVGHGVSRG